MMRLLIEAGNATVAVANGYIVEPSGTFDHVIRLPDGEVWRGLVNAHDHLHRNHFGRPGNGPYTNAYDWARDIQDRHAAAIAQGRRMDRRRALLHGAWKNLLSGVTHVVHHDPWEPDFDRDFPLHVVRLDCADSLGMTPGLLPRPGALFALHLAEGMDLAAAEEVRTAAVRGLLNRDLLAVHVVGADAEGVARLRVCGCAVVWCPSSNRFLFGRTAPEALLAEGMDVLLGSDSMLTGDGTLLDEMRIARGTLCDARLLAAVGSLAARRLKLEWPGLAPGTLADLALFRRPLLAADIADVALVMASGELRAMDDGVAALLHPAGGQVLDWRGARHWIGEPEPLFF